MNVNGISNQASAYASYSTGVKSTEAAAKTEAAQATAVETNGVVYEPSSAKGETAVSKKEQNAALVQQLKADAEARSLQLQQLVQEMMSKQGSAYGAANGGMWKFLASGNFTVDAQTKAQAQADIAEDGYWGVKQTSDRIFDFAQALSGGDADKMKEMQAAFEKGFKQATKTWGKALPDISQQTYAAVNQKFEDYYAGLQAEA